ncbi:hypothetical protein L2E82_00586 [Cichorium intybus]|uniref:Uncharacterized protein n=1 Tax=Cichorium intybus TaxID=13427 RepID=A0ACB9GZ65_CICIN|nr:hypothetical protein L2E82_00586 [Cichorium intybus]
MGDPVEQLLRRMEVPASVLIYDTYLTWGVNLGNRMNIPVASLFPMSATVFSMTYYYNLLIQNGHVGDNFAEKAEEEVDYIPGVRPIRVVDLVTCFNGNGKEVMPELESQVIDAMKSELSMPVYAIGPAIPYFNGDNIENDQNTPTGPSRKDKNTPDYIKWLDHQPEASVLYISQGSFLSVSNAQLEEIIGGVHDSGVRYIWITRGETSRFKHENDEKALVIPWCDQLRVLCHSSIGVFWSHCGWNSTKESAFSGVPMLTFPIFYDQVPNSKMIVDDWKMGTRVRIDEGILVTREEIVKVIKCFMDQENEEGKKMRRRALEVERICRQAIAEGGSAQIDINSFISDISMSHYN